MFRTSFERGMFCRYLKRENAVGTILYIHGLGESGLCFESLITSEALSKWSHLVLDLEGYGKSLWTEQPNHLEQHADSLAEWLRSHQIEQTVVLGHSMGGVIGTIFLEKYSNLVQALINVEGNISIEDCVFSGQAAAYPLEAFQAHGFSTICNSIYLDGVTDPALRGYYVSLRLCQPLTYYVNSKELVELSEGKQLASRLGALQLPTLYLLGNPRGTGAYSRSMLTAAGVKWQAIEDAGHWVFIDQSTAFTHEVNCFLSQLQE